MIIARQGFAGRGDLSECLVITGGKVQVRSPHALRKSTVVEDEPHPLKFVRFFAPEDVGLSLDSDKADVRVKAVRPGGPCDKAGLRAGDVFASCDGTPVRDAETFRRLLRRKSHEGWADFVVRRAGATVNLTVDFRP